MTGSTPPVRTRIEPSPSGSIHVGNAYAATFNWLWARKNNGAFILRIADTDAARVTPEAITTALEDLRWLGLEWDEGPEVGGPYGPYIQSERIQAHKEAAADLLDKGAAYRCYCTAEELEARRGEALAAGRPPGYDGRCRRLTDAERKAFEYEGRPWVARFAMPEGETRLKDLIRGEVVWDHRNITDFVIQRADGSPLYMLAVSYDDMAMRVSHVVRADEHLSNTPKQIELIKAMGGSPPAYGHLPLIVGPDRKKLAKRFGATSVGAYREMGILPEVLLNYLVGLSWSIGDGMTERFTPDELTDAFTFEGVTRNPSAFDLVKLESWNGDSIRALPFEQYVELLKRFLERDGVSVDDGLLAKMAPHVQERMKRLDEATAQLRFLFVEQVEPDEKAAAKLNPELLASAADVLRDVEWTVEAITEAMMAWADRTGVKRKDALQPLRAAVTGSLVSPPLFESIEALGRERTLARIEAALRLVAHG